MDFATIAATVKRPRQTVRLCLRADLFAARDRLVRELAGASSDTLAGPSPSVRDKLAALDLEMEAATADFIFEAVSRATFTAIEDANPSTDDGPSRDFMAELIAASVVEPEMTKAQVDELFGLLSDGQTQVIEDAAWTVNRETGSVPFSASD